MAAVWWFARKLTRVKESQGLKALITVTTQDMCPLREEMRLKAMDALIHL
jgi:hypothetical protein